MRIGIYPALAPSSGGIYQYSLSMLSVLAQWKIDGCEDRFVLFTDKIVIPLYRRNKWQWMDCKTATIPAAGVEYAAANRRRGATSGNVAMATVANVAISNSVQAGFTRPGCGAPSARGKPLV